MNRPVPEMLAFLMAIAQCSRSPAGIIGAARSRSRSSASQKKVLGTKITLSHLGPAQD